MLLRLQIRWTRYPEAIREDDRYLEIEFGKEEDSAWLGRAADVTVRLPHPTVSERHARVFRKDRAIWIEESGSTNGTILNGKEIHPGKPHLLQPGDMMSVGPFMVSVLAGDRAGEQTGKTSTEAVAMDLVRGYLEREQTVDADGQPHLEVKNGRGSGTRANLTLGSPTVVGRDPGCDLSVDDPDVSRNHARVFSDLDGTYLSDMDSKNGVWLDGRKISGSFKLHSGQQFRIGETTIEYIDPAEQYLASLEKMADHVLSKQAREDEGLHDAETTILPQALTETDHTLDEKDTTAPEGANAEPTPSSKAGFWILVAVGCLTAAAAIAALVFVLTRT